MGVKDILDAVDKLMWAESEAQRVAPKTQEKIQDRPQENTPVRTVEKRSPPRVPRKTWSPPGNPKGGATTSRHPNRKLETHPSVTDHKHQDGGRGEREAERGPPTLMCATRVIGLADRPTTTISRVHTGLIPNAREGGGRVFLLLSPPSRLETRFA